MKNRFNQKTDFLFHRVVNNPQWDDRSETMLVVLGMIYYGYSLGINKNGELSAYDMNQATKHKLRTLNIQANYIDTMVDYAHKISQAPQDNIYCRLIALGKNYANHYDIDPLVYSVFEYTEEIKLNR
ncbi:hypothetical protein [Myroides pelagicus]|uniref:Uncharacterized protein n=1 Tax=Myroides pelagicus TaxID=270914 RepID=A0A7K1GNM9_9FLAO|nr:hypothetical protein [Myroides pelagicus]MEC4113090.1 hypothetical protein [Myroides pelagicus]MTH29993.1 hypothetical protein [Myroides pelagicus]